MSDVALKPKEVIAAISGLIVGMFVALISSTVVSPALPRIVTDLGGDQSAYTWIVTASLLAMTVSTPIWGKLSDLLNRKLLVQLGLIVFTLGSIAAGFAPDTTWLIVARLVQGIGIGGLMALVQIVVADIISPRERGKYMGVIGAVMGVGQVAGPLVGGFITDSIGWHWTFWVFAPFSVVAIIMIQRTLHLPKRPPRAVKVDYLGAALIAAGVATLLIWVSLAAASEFDWWSWPTVFMVGGAVIALALVVPVELRATEPIIPMRLFRDRTFTLSVIASIAVGVAMFGTAVFLSQYMQLARGASPTQAGLMTLPMVAGQLVGGIVIGQLISRFGKWKRYVVGGAIVFTGGLALMSTIHYNTNFGLVSVFMFLLGLGMGAVMQNLVLVVQNSVAAKDMGAASAGVTFFRSLGGTLGVSALGALLAGRLPVLVTDGMKTADLSHLTPQQLQGAQAALGSGSLPDLSTLPGVIRSVIESAYGTGIAEQFLVAVPIAIIALVAVIFLPNKSLSRLTAAQKLAREAENVALEFAEAQTANDSPEAVEAELVLTGPIDLPGDAGRREPSER